MKFNPLVFVVVLFSAQMAFAQLGADKSTIDQAALAPHAERLATQSSGKFEVHAIRQAKHNIKYFVTNDTGKIFCESWSGMKTPDLKTMLGEYNDEYVAAFLKAKRKGSRNSVVKTENVYVERHGMMRNIRGKACLLASKPTNVTFGEVQ
jgi:hypothetical protein